MFPCFHLNPAWYICRSNLNRMFATQYAILTLTARFVLSIMWAHCEHVLLQKRGWFYGAFGSFTVYLDYLSKPSIFLLICSHLPEFWGQDKSQWDARNTFFKLCSHVSSALCTSELDNAFCIWLSAYEL